MLKKVPVNLPQDLIEKIKRRAEEAERSFSSQCRILLRRGLENKVKENGADLLKKCEASAKKKTAGLRRILELEGI